MGRRGLQDGNLRGKEDADLSVACFKERYFATRWMRIADAAVPPRCVLVPDFGDGLRDAFE